MILYDHQQNNINYKITKTNVFAYFVIQPPKIKLQFKTNFKIKTKKKYNNYFLIQLRRNRFLSGTIAGNDVTATRKRSHGNRQTIAGTARRRVQRRQNGAQIFCYLKCYRQSCCRRLVSSDVHLSGWYIDRPVRAPD